MITFTSIVVLLIIFYLGAVLASARCWHGVFRGNIRYAQLRDLTGVADRAALRRMFGLTGKDGSYRVTFADVMRRRRAAGIVLTDLPVHLLFLSVLGWTFAHPGGPAAAAIVCTAAVHAVLLGCAAASILVAGRQALPD